MVATAGKGACRAAAIQPYITANANRPPVESIAAQQYTSMLAAKLIGTNVFSSPVHLSATIVGIMRPKMPTPLRTINR